MARKPTSSKSLMGRFRDHVGLSLRELAERTQINMNTLASSEYGRNGISSNVLNHLRAVFPQEVDEIFGANREIKQTDVKDLIDLEIGAMNKVYHVLKPIDEPARQRVIQWVLKRLDDKEKS